MSRRGVTSTRTDRSHRAASRARSTARSKTREAQTWADRVQDWLPPPVRGVIERARADDIQLFAAGLGFYALVSVVPLSILILWVTSLVPGDARIHQEWPWWCCWQSGCSWRTS